MRSHPGKVVTIYDIPELVDHAQLHGLTPQNITSGFQRTEFYLFNRGAFCKTEFEPAAVTDRDLQKDLPSSSIKIPTTSAEPNNSFCVSQTLPPLF